jgi:estrone sulfotransferase
VVAFIEGPIQGNLSYLETLWSPRLLATHMPLSLLPKSVVSSGCWIVYMCRDPKDAFVSWWYFYNKVHIGYHIDLKTAFNMFSEGFSDHGPCWDHYHEYWRESNARSDKVLFLKYEDMILEPIKHVIRLASFLGAPFSIREEEDGVPEQLVRLCRASPRVCQINLASIYFWQNRKNCAPTVWHPTWQILATWQISPLHAHICALSASAHRSRIRLRVHI